MDTHVLRSLQDKLYDKRKAGALELEATIRKCLAENDHDRIADIVHTLCHDFAYSVHAPNARNGGLIGLAAAAIALGSEVARYLKEIVPPVLACFTDQDARVRYYACESMYNIAKVAKGETLIFFNEVFDALSKMAADPELSVKNGAELLDRLIKDIVSESAAMYATIMVPDPAFQDPDGSSDHQEHMRRAFSLPRFIPLLEERINVQNPFARTFLVSWITLLDQIPDLELVIFLPSFLRGLLRFLSDSNEDVHTATKAALDRFLVEIKQISAVQKAIAEKKRLRAAAGRKASDSSYAAADSQDDGERDEGDYDQSRENRENGEMIYADPARVPVDEDDAASGSEDSVTADEDYDDDGGLTGDEWIPGQDVDIDFAKILETLVNFLAETRNQEVQVTALKWIETFLDICPEEILAFTPKLLAQLLPALSHDKDQVSQAAKKVNSVLMDYIMSLPEDRLKSVNGTSEPSQVNLASATVATANQSQTQNPVTGAPTSLSLRPVANANSGDKRESLSGHSKTSRKAISPEPSTGPRSSQVVTPEPSTPDPGVSDHGHTGLDYEAAVGALTLQFLHEHEATRVAALAWLIALHRKSPRKILGMEDATFPALLKTLSDPAEAVVTRDLVLLSQISKSNDDSYFTSFMVNLLKLFCTDRRLLEMRGNLIVRQLCISLSAERIFRTMADCIERDEDMEFASIMVQNLNNNLITAPELAELRKRLRNLDSRDGQTFFTTLFRAWCVNAVSTFSLCLLAQAYEQAYNLLQVFCDIEMTVSTLIQIDKLVQLLESPVFTYLRMQLLEPERYPYLYKCLYGLLMLLPQSAAFAALRNRLNSVSAIGYLQIGGIRSAPPATTTVSTFERSRLKGREEGSVKWSELLEKFRATQEKIRRSQQRQLISLHGLESEVDTENPSKGLAQGQKGPGGRVDFAPTGAQPQQGRVGSGLPPAGHSKGKSSLSNLGRFTSGVRTGKTKK